MRYWVYINDKVEGPYEEDKLVTLQGFTPDTLICSEEIAAGGSQEWVKASSIFEFDQIEKTVNQPLPAAEVFKTKTQAQTQPENAEKTQGVSGILLEKMDLLTREVESLQAKLDGMQHKLDEALVAAQNGRAASGQAPAFVPPQDDVHNTITLTRQDLDPVNEDALITNTESLVSQAEDIIAAAAQDKPLDMLGPVDLGEKNSSAQTEVALGSKAEEEVVLRSALDSLYNAKTVQSEEEKESTFQDLLTPKQAQALSAQAAALQQAKEETKPSLDDALKAADNAWVEVSTPSVDEASKDALISELTAEPKEDVLDQVIKEKEEEKKADALGLAAAGAAAVIGVAALTGEEEKKEETPAVEVVEAVEEIFVQPTPAEAPVQEQPIFEMAQENVLPDTAAADILAAEEMPAEKQTLDFEEVQAGPALSIAPDAAEPEKQEEVLPASQMPADEPAKEEAPAAPAGYNPFSDLPTIEDAGEKPQMAVAEEEKDETLQELVPGATAEKPEGVIITAADLKDAFTERDTKDQQSVEQLFGVAPVQTVTTAATDMDQTQPGLPQFSDQTADKPLPVGNPNDLTEIELKEGSTYLISDFVPPAQTDANALPKELNGLEKAAETAEDVFAQTEEPAQTAEVQEMVSTLKQTEKTVEPATDAPSDVTVSQVILENTIKTKRGATLDIKTVPMVPEPAQSDRLRIDDLDDDINTQHDMKSADVKTSGGMTKLIVGTLVAIILAAVIYVMLAFMNLIPPQFNLLASKPTAEQQAEQNVQMEEMLGAAPAQPQTDMTAQAQMPAAMNPMDQTLDEVKNFPLVNGFTLKEFIDAKHPAAKNLITWDISTAVDPDNYSILVKVPPENPQSFKISYRFNFNTVTKALDPTISDAKNLLDSAAQGVLVQPQQPAMQQPMMPVQPQPQAPVQQRPAQRMAQ